MTAPAGRSEEGPRLNRCRCGHYPVSHMRVAALGAAGSGSYRLEPTAPCALCGPTACPRFHPLGPPETSP
ncbi:MAG TPA: hypothetical protein VFG07_02545 [Thermoplasmata archaeon]|nr:hypothetical protein [Thermoplasmata archaeon]